MSILKPGDVVVAYFPGVTGVKRRPAVVVSTDSYHNHRPDVILGAITTNLSAATTPKDCKDNVVADPRFKNPEKGDLSLHPTSPVKDMGAFPLTGRAVKSLNKDITTWGMMKKR